ncbi:MAG: HD domain-containing protein [Clostridia bacterium]|nr:HD domain-containing protein [Clostridia bacterium]MDD4048051.1 HD domain-containing protein [Clostridia bacterium]
MVEIDLGAKKIIDRLYSKGFEGYVVGGCVRDMLLKKTPKDWDITTDAQPEQIKLLFTDTIDTGLKHGTVTVVINGNNYEITTYRIDGIYSDNRRPDKVIYTTSLENDLSRRDFTINAMAYNIKQGLVDPFNGVTDLKNKNIKAVGDPNKRLQEDALRMMRAVRFSAQLGFSIEKETEQGIYVNSNLIKNISMERVRDELVKILTSDNPVFVSKLSILGLMENIIPEINRCIGFNQRNPHHFKDVFEHTMIVLENTSNNKIIRLAALLHDVAKPVTFTLDKRGIGHFYGHHIEGQLISESILKRLKFDNETIEKVCILVREHMSRFSKFNEKSVKKFINRVGVTNLEDLYELQIADIKGSSPPHDFIKVMELRTRIERILNKKEPLTIKDLDINGYDLIDAGIKPGAIMGRILNSLLDKVLENPELNKKEQLLILVKKEVNTQIKQQQC